jgi:viroplasmin and RNaseH domain-containing protein
MYKQYVSVEHKKDFVEFEHNKIYLDPTKHESGKNQLGQDDSLATYAFIQEEFSKVLGKVLTLVDASISEKNQNKAFKDIIKNYFAEEYGFLSEMLLDQKIMERSANFAWENGQMEVRDIDDALGIKKE